MRRFEIAKGYDKTLKLPQRSTALSAGYDFSICEDLTIEPYQIAYAKTGIKVKMAADEVLKIYPRSSLPSNYGLTIPNSVGIIDADYYNNESNDGAIFIQLYNFTNKTAFLQAGTRVAQGIFTQYLTVEDDHPVKAKRQGGFGSTGA